MPVQNRQELTLMINCCLLADLRSSPLLSPPPAFFCVLRWTKFALIIIFVIFSISRRDSENNGFLVGVRLLPPPSPVVSRPNSLPLPFRTPAAPATLETTAQRSNFRGHPE